MFQRIKGLGCCSAASVGLTDHARVQEEVRRPVQFNCPLVKSAPRSAPKATRSSSPAWDYSPVDMLGMRSKFVNVGAKRARLTKWVRQNRLRQS